METSTPQVKKFIFKGSVCYNIQSNEIDNHVSFELDATDTKFLEVMNESQVAHYISFRFKTRKSDVLSNREYHTRFENVSEIKACMSPLHTYPWFELYVTPWIGFYRPNIPGRLKLSSNSYYVKRIVAPYIDDCVNYTQLGFLDRNDAINSCMNDIGVSERKRGNYAKIFDDEFDYSTEELSDFRPNCTRLYYNLDCLSSSVITYMSKEEAKFIQYETGLSNKPSFFIRSQPKIVPIDYLTYILGTLGTWLGFCFLDLNPSKYLLRFTDQTKNVENSKVGPEDLLQVLDNSPEIQIHSHKINQIMHRQNFVIKQLELLKKSDNNFDNELI